MSNKEYQAPEVDDLSGDDKKEKVAAPATTTQTTAPAEAKPVDEATFQEVPEVVGVSKMVNAKGNLTTDIMLKRIQVHVDFLSGKKRYSSDKEMIDEQKSFMETVGNSLQLEFEQYVIVTDDILKAIRDNKEAFDSGSAFRFIVKLDKNIPPQHIRKYQTYMQMLIRLAKNWESRYRLPKLVDLATAIEDLPKKGKENVTLYYNYMTKI